MKDRYCGLFSNNTKVNDDPNEPMDLVEVKLFIQHFLLRVGYGVGNSDVAKMFRELANKWDD